MPKLICLLFAGLCCIEKVAAQPAGYLYALNTAGTSGASGNIAISYSVGEAVVFANSCSYSPGIIQPTCICIVSVEDAPNLGFTSRFYPNPTSSHVVVETNFLGFASYTIHTVDGRLVASNRFGYTPIEVYWLAPGNYLLRLSTADNQFSTTAKIIKQ